MRPGSPASMRPVLKKALKISRSLVCSGQKSADVFFFVCFFADVQLEFDDRKGRRDLIMRKLMEMPRFFSTETAHYFPIAEVLT